MAHLSLQLGGALVVPFGAPRRPRGDGRNWRFRALREAAAGRDGRPRPSRRCRRRAIPPAVPAARGARAETAGE
jgi:hypothetical protein